ncbi:MAG TPA: Fe-S cluster assembly protein SufD [Dehalococcoidia bacterium]
MTQVTLDTFRFAPGFTKEAVETLSREKCEPDWMRERRLEAWNVYEQTPLPTPQQRAWKYTDVSRLNFGAFVPHARPVDDHESVAALPAPPAGQFSGLLRQFDSHGHDAQLDDELRNVGVIFCSIDRAVKEFPELVQQYFMTECVPVGRDKFTALHAAFWSGGAFVYVPKNVVVKLPLYSLLSVATENMAVFPHVLVVADVGSQVSIVEEYGSPDSVKGIFSSGVTEIFVRDNAHVRYANLQRWGDTTQHFGMQRVVLDRDARLNFVTVGLGGRLSKVTGESVMRGSGSSSELLGLFFGRKNQQFDYVTLQDHQAPNTTSDLLFKSALNDRARSIYYGLVRVGPNARLANANQENRNLLLSGSARADSDPVLEILTSQVARCTHGASVGPVDDEQLFYVQSRGISRPQAEKILVTGFFHQVTGRVPDEALRTRMEQAIDERVEF